MNGEIYADNLDFNFSFRTTLNSRKKNAMSSQARDHSTKKRYFYPAYWLHVFILLGCANYVSSPD